MHCCSWLLDRPQLTTIIIMYFIKSETGSTRWPTSSEVDHSRLRLDSNQHTSLSCAYEIRTRSPGYEPGVLPLDDGAIETAGVEPAPSWLQTRRPSSWSTSLWSRWAMIPLPIACKAIALPIELQPQKCRLRRAIFLPSTASISRHRRTVKSHSA